MGFITSRSNYKPNVNVDGDLQPQDGKFATLDEVIDKKIGLWDKGSRGAPVIDPEIVDRNRAILSSKPKRKRGTGSITVHSISGKFSVYYKDRYFGRFDTYEEAEEKLSKVTPPGYNMLEGNSGHSDENKPDPNNQITKSVEQPPPPLVEKPHPIS
jgi:hypothetical protein